MPAPSPTTTTNIATNAMPSATYTYTYTPFVLTIVAGVVTTLIISLAASRREAARRGLDSAAAWGRDTFVAVLRWVVLRVDRKGIEAGVEEEKESARRGEEKEGGDEGDEMRAEEVVEKLAETGVVEKSEVEEEINCARIEQTGITKKAKKEKKPFEFRERLWNEPPEGHDLRNDYDHYGCDDAVQKEFKAVRGKDLEWKTNWLDLTTERWLLSDYSDWASEMKKGEGLSEKEREFYEGLDHNIWTDCVEIGEEGNENDKRHGKTEKDWYELRDFVEEIRDREKQKKSGRQIWVCMPYSTSNQTTKTYKRIATSQRPYECALTSYGLVSITCLQSVQTPTSTPPSNNASPNHQHHTTTSPTTRISLPSQHAQHSKTPHTRHPPHPNYQTLYPRSHEPPSYPPHAQAHKRPTMAHPTPTTTTVTTTVTTNNMNATTYTPFVLTFVAGLATALLISIAISRREALQRGVVAAAMAVGRVLPWWRGGPEGRHTRKEVEAGREDGGKEEGRGVEGEGKKDKGKGRAVVEKKPFEFRERLWHEPPEGQDLKDDYDWYECFDAVQKEFKDAGGKDFEWKTKWLDLQTELWLLGDYRDWAYGMEEDEELSEKEWAFYQGLLDNVKIDWDEVYWEDHENHERHGKTLDDRDKIYRFMKQIRAREAQKRSRR